MSKQDALDARISKWVSNLSDAAKCEMLLYMTNELIDSGTLHFKGYHSSPVHDCTGEPIDGSSAVNIEE